MRIEALETGHRPLLTGFQNQHPSLVEYLKRYALRHATKDLLARTFVAIDDTPTRPRVAGYFSLATVSVDRASAEKHPNLTRPPRFPIPGVLLARLAVESRVQGQGLGRYLFEEALGLTLQLAKDGPVAFRLLVTDAIDAAAARFYERHGLVRLSDEYPCRMVLDLRPVLEP
ncbi:MAG TPA: GNAT family N-acetyltransferase [Polyangia bacterium]|nr:GNAT family N-acetyltransferase [Polyangia bacterium]